jgi:hypothetical protein
VVREQWTVITGQWSVVSDEWKLGAICFGRSLSRQIGRAKVNIVLRGAWRTLAAGEDTMPEQFKSETETKVEDETATDQTAQKKIDHIANKAAEKSSKTVQGFDKENSNLFNK